jgi:hypothetical protein
LNVVAERKQRRKQSVPHPPFDIAIRRRAISARFLRGQGEADALF